MAGWLNKKNDTEIVDVLRQEIASLKEDVKTLIRQEVKSLKEMEWRKRWDHGDLLRVDGATILRLREAKGMSQTEMAHAIGYHQISLSNVEHGRIRSVLSDRVEKMADILGVTVETLFPSERAADDVPMSDPHLVFYNGGKIAEIRRKAGITQPKLAEMADCAYGLVKRLEHNAYKKTARRNLEAIANCLHIKVEELIAKEEMREHQRVRVNGQAIRDMRKNKVHISLRELAKMADVKCGALSTWENGEINTTSRDKLERVAAALGVSVEKISR